MYNVRYLGKAKYKKKKKEYYRWGRKFLTELFPLLYVRNRACRLRVFQNYLDFMKNSRGYYYLGVQKYFPVYVGMYCRGHLFYRL